MVGSSKELKLKVCTDEWRTTGGSQILHVLGCNHHAEGSSYEEIRPMIRLVIVGAGKAKSGMYKPIFILSYSRVLC